VAGAAALLAATLIALFIANSRWSTAYEALWHVEAGFTLGPYAFHESLLHWVNDALMALFFFVVGLEIKREFLVGELSQRRKAILPVLAAVGGMAIPALIYLTMNRAGAGSHGWGVPMATDIAFVIGVMALLGNRVPAGLKVFIVALAIADDIGAIIVIATFYTTGVKFGWLGLAAAFFVVLIVLNRRQVDSPWPYFLIGGMLWFSMLMSGVHSTIAGVLVAMTIPSVALVDPLDFTRTTRERLDRIEEAHVPGAHVLCEDTQQLVALDIRREARHTAPPLQRLEFALHPWTTFLVLPLFALGNAGVRLVGENVGALLTTPVALGVIFGLVFGKPIGVIGMTFVAVWSGVAELPDGVHWGHIAGAGVLAGIGFTMSLFVASIAFRGALEATEAKAAILVASVIAGALGYAVLRLVSRARAA
jgi:NhaA family Na+:H+ antiporter